MHSKNNLSGIQTWVEHQSGQFAFSASPTKETDRCALCFFGLPRSYRTMVLPSIRQNILKPNAGCDIFVHYFYQETEAKGRYNGGGKLDPSEILLLENEVVGTNRIIRFTNDTDAQFFDKRKEEFSRYDNTTGADGKPAYYPWKEEGWAAVTQINLIRQWHSVERAFLLMEEYAQQNQINYNRVAMLRNDVMFLTPIDIKMLDNETIDEENKHFVLPAFANYPVNDRMIYGPYEAVKVWATRRFELIEERVKDPEAAGYVLHSERFVNEALLPTIQEMGYAKLFNPDICFSRTRAKDVTVFNDCVRGKSAVRGNLANEKHLKKLVEGIYGKSCGKPIMFKENRNIKYLNCGG